MSRCWGAGCCGGRALGGRVLGAWMARESATHTEWLCRRLLHIHVPHPGWALPAPPLFAAAPPTRACCLGQHQSSTSLTLAADLMCSPGALLGPMAWHAAYLPCSTPFSLTRLPGCAAALPPLIQVPLTPWTLPQPGLSCSRSWTRAEASAWCQVSRAWGWRASPPAARLLLRPQLACNQGL